MNQKNIISNNTVGGRAILLLVMLAVLVFGGSVSAYAQTEDGDKSQFSALDTIPEAARALFESHVAKEDTVKAQELKKYRSDKLIKRFSIHTNVVDWATLVPNIGIEFDINPTVRNNYSVSVFGKFNGNSSHGKLVYNVNGIRVEGRKYWRTGKFGTPRGSANRYYSQFEEIITDSTSIYFNADTLAGYKYYADELGHKAKDLGVTNKDVYYSVRAGKDWSDEKKDSLDFAEDSLVSDKSKLRTWIYNTYHKVRRNYTSGRTLDNPRNWRAYYFGVWAGMDNWSLALTGKGTQGNGIGLGISGGYSIPLFPQKYPKEGSLDLDLGITVGLRAVRYDAYTYDQTTEHYLLDQARSHPGWKVVPYPVIHELRVGLVWRFRGIKRKVDRSLIDDYLQEVNLYTDKKSAAYNKHIDIQTKRSDVMSAIAARESFRNDSTSESDELTRLLLEMAMEMNPDTVFTGQDQVDYLRLIKGIKVKDQKKYLLQEEAKKEKEKQAAEKLAIKAEEALQDSLSKARRDSIRAEKAKAKTKKKGKDKDEKSDKEEKVDKKEKKDSKDKEKKDKKKNSEATENEKEEMRNEKG
ncbi:MAG: DUF3575 domain-containing protein [Bacteroidaceae bacterium]|nr:DUF3575 domain-containing protein [Bacteroidaceae bacterium]